MLIHNQLEEDLPCDSEKITSFIKELESSLPDTRDNRGKRHGLAFVVACFVLATLCGRHKLSSIHRFMRNRLNELRTMTNILDAQLISRAQLPRVLDSLDWVELNAIIQRCFGVWIAKSDKKRWVAIDGKTFTAVASRWKESHLATLVVMTRDTFDVAKQKKSVDTSYYISNQSVNPDDSALSAELVNAIQEHWGVESNNWIRDVTFNEDKIKVKAGNQAQVMGRLRGLAIELTRKTGCDWAMLFNLAGVNPALVAVSHRPGIESCRHASNNVLDA